MTMPKLTMVAGTISIEASKTTVLELLTYLNNAYQTNIQAAVGTYLPKQP